MLVHNSSIGRVSNSGDELNMPMTCFLLERLQRVMLRIRAIKFKTQCLSSSNGWSQTGRLFKPCRAWAKGAVATRCACARARLCTEIIDLAYCLCIEVRTYIAHAVYLDMCARSKEFGWTSNGMIVSYYNVSLLSTTHTQGERSEAAGKDCLSHNKPRSNYIHHNLHVHRWRFNDTPRCRQIGTRCYPSFIPDLAPRQTAFGTTSTCPMFKWIKSMDRERERVLGSGARIPT